MRKHFFVALAIAFVLVIQTAHAGTVVTIVDVVNVDGKIGIQLRNEFFPTIFTDSSSRNASTISLYLDGIKAPVDTTKTIESLSPGREALVVLKSPWPSTEYYNLTIGYTDSSGSSSYPTEWALVFAKPAFKVKEVITEPYRIFTNSSVTVKLKLLAAGDKDISNINMDLITQPKYFFIADRSNPAFMKAGEEKEFVYKFKSSGEKMPDTIIYATSYFPTTLTYNYYGFSTKTLINESFVVFNRYAELQLLPKLDVKIDMNSTIEQGSSIDAALYVWNTGLSEGHNACDVNITIQPSSSEIQIPVSTILLGAEFSPKVDAPEEPTSTFSIQTTNTTPLRDYKLNLKATYKDCEWRSTDILTKSISFSVTKPGQIASQPPVVAEEPAQLPPKVETPPPLVNVPPSKPKGEESITTIFIIVIAIIGIIALFVVVYYLEIRSRSIF